MKTNPSVGSAKETRSRRTSGAGMPRVHVVATGGTIAMHLDPDQGGAIPAVSGANLVAAAPEVAQIARFSVLVRPLYAYMGGGGSLRKASAIMAGNLTAQKARVLLMLALAAGERGEVLRSRFEGHGL